MAIDWEKPLRNKATRNTWVVVGKHPDLPERYCVFCENTARLAWARSDGSLTCDKINLENIPAEPEREEGAYVVSAKGTIALFGFLAGDWYERGKKVDAPDRVIERWYSELEYRPADKCPPPMDGTPFEVESWGCRFWYYRMEGLFRHVDGDAVWAPVNLLDSKTRWRPLQDSQP